MHSYQNNSKKSSTAKIIMCTPSGYSLFTNCSFDSTRNGIDCYRSKDYMERFCKDLKKHEILPSNQKQIIEQAKLTYSLLGKSFEKQIKTIEDLGKRQVKVLEDLRQKE